MTEDEYCIKICKGKCCSVYDQDKKPIWRCPLQCGNGACSIYSEWQNGTCNKTYNEIGCDTADIYTLLKFKALPDWVEAQCCYAHPELLNGH